MRNPSSKKRRKLVRTGWAKSCPRKMKFKKGDMVVVIAGDDKGKNGEILKVFPTEQRLLIGGINLRTKVIRPKTVGDPAAHIAKIETPIHCSNVAHIDPRLSVPVRAGYKIVNEKKVRYSKKTQEVIG